MLASHRKLQFLLLLTITTYTFVTSAFIDNEKLKFKVLENTSTADCPYIGNVTIETRYKKRFFTSDYADIVVRATYDEMNYTRIYSKEIEKGRGHIVLTFDVGDCAKDLLVRLRN